MTKNKMKFIYQDAQKYFYDAQGHLIENYKKQMWMHNVSNIAKILLGILILYLLFVPNAQALSIQEKCEDEYNNSVAEFAECIQFYLEFNKTTYINDSTDVSDLVSREEFFDLLNDTAYFELEKYKVARQFDLEIEKIRANATRLVQQDECDDRCQEVKETNEELDYCNNNPSYSFCPKYCNTNSNLHDFCKYYEKTTSTTTNDTDRNLEIKIRSLEEQIKNQNQEPQTSTNEFPLSRDALILTLVIIGFLGFIFRGKIQFFAKQVMAKNNPQQYQTQTPPPPLVIQPKELPKESATTNPQPETKKKESTGWGNN